MLAYELATGRAYFKGKTPPQIMKILGRSSTEGGFQPPLSAMTNINAGNGNYNNDNEAIVIQDKHLIDLIRSCLQVDPRYRINVNQILRHSYFKQQLLLSQNQNQSQQRPIQQQQQQPLQSPPQSPQQQQQPGGGGGGGTFW
jgi:serine/threonine protein kinase